MKHTPFIIVTTVLWASLLSSCSAPSRPAGPDTLAKPLGSVTALPAPQQALKKDWPRNQSAMDWPCFGGSPSRQQTSTVSFASADLKLRWQYTLGDHVYQYRSGTNIWSESAIAVTTGEETRILIGAYDRKLHCLDGVTGKRLWRFTTGDEIVAAPCATTSGLVLPSTDRSIYGLSHGGERRWVDQTMAWSHTVAPAITASPVPFSLNGIDYVAGGYFINDFSWSNRRQEGYSAVWNATTGKTLWRVLLRRDHIHGPAVGLVAGRPILFFTTGDGVVAALDGRSGTVAWTQVSDERIRACPTFVTTKKGPLVLVTTRWGMLWALAANTGKPVWSYRAGHMADGSVAVAQHQNDTGSVLFGTYDRCLHCVDLATGLRRWKFTTGSVIVCSPAVAIVGNEAACFFSSLDDKLYCLAVDDGRQLWSHPIGTLPWPYFKRGDAVFGSPIVYRTARESMVLFAGHDSTLYAFAAGREPAMPPHSSGK